MKEAQTDLDLLREFVERKSDGAFTELVHRHVDLVYSVALRLLRGDSHFASDATQAVFFELARNARKLTNHQSISGWLYRTTRFVASRMGRSELRRAAREHAFAMTHSEHSHTEAGWNDVESLLEDAMQDLCADDREAVLLRFFRNESFAAIGDVFGASENAARMRVQRALEKLRGALNRRGVKCPSAVLGGLLAANAISSAPAGLAATIAMPAIASAAAASTLPKTLKFLEIMAKTKMKAAVVILALAGTTTGWITARKNSTNAELELARIRQEAITQGETVAPDDASKSLSPQERSSFLAERAELMRLRAEVTELRRQVREKKATAALAKGARPEPPHSEPDRQPKWKSIEAKLTIAKFWALAFHKFAQANNGQMPTDFQKAAEHFPDLSEEFSRLGGIGGNGFEITFQGRLEDIENPKQAIIMREKHPFALEEDGSAQRTYLFADGHSEVHRAMDANFEGWEEQRRPLLKQDASAAE